MSQYVDHKAAAKSYRPQAGSMSPGLKRAREPYRIRNALVGLALGAFAAGVWAYSISAVKQDVFDDVDEEARSMASTGTGTGPGVAVISAAEEEKKKNETLTAVGSSILTPAAVQKIVVSVPVSPPSRGVLQRLDSKLPWLLDPGQKTLVWGAPSVDNVGKIGKS